MKETLKRIGRELVCIILGCPCNPTGRHANLLTEWECYRCHRKLVSHAEHGNALVPADDASNAIFQTYLKAHGAFRRLAT